MRPRTWEFSLAAGSSTTIYAPVDVHAAPDWGIGFTQISGSGHITGASAAYTMHNVLGRGVTSAGWAAVTSAAAAVTGFSIQFNGALSCFRFAVSSSGAASYGWTLIQAGPDRVA